MTQFLGCNHRHSSLVFFLLLLNSWVPRPTRVSPEKRIGKTKKDTGGKMGLLSGAQRINLD